MTPCVATQALPDGCATVEQWPLTDLRPNPDNPRGPVTASDVFDPKNSIQVQGLLAPLVILTGGTVLAGHRRLRALLLLAEEDASGRWDRVAVIVREMDKANALAVMLSENIQRADLTPVQEARSFGRLIETWDKAEVARRCGVTVAFINARLVILKLCPEVQDMFGVNALPMTVARVLAQVPDVGQQRRFANLAMRRLFTVPQLEDVVARGIGLKPARPRPHRTGDAAGELVGDKCSGGSEVPLSWTRESALNKLRVEADKSICFADLANIFVNVCCACGMESSPTICAACPLAEFMAKIGDGADGDSGTAG